VVPPLVYGFPHSEKPLKRYQEEWSSHTMGRADLIDMDILLMAEDMKNKLKWNTKMGRLSGDKLEWFSSRSLHLSNKGTMQSTWGGLIGVPLFYSPKFLAKVRESPELLAMYNIDLSTEVGKKMFQLIQLDDNAKKFSLAKEMVQTKSTVLYINAVAMGALTIVCYPLSVTLSSLMPFTGSMLLSYILLIPVVTFLGYKFVDLQNRWAEQRVIKRVSELDEDTARGGLDFYTSLIERQRLVDNEGFNPDVSREFEPMKRPLCDFVLTCLDYFKFDQWFLEYRTVSLTNEQRKQIVESVIEKNYSKPKQD